MLTGIQGESSHFYIEHYLDEVRVLDHAALQTLFPQATVVRERFLRLTKSLMAVLPER